MDRLGIARSLNGIGVGAITGVEHDGTNVRTTLTIVNPPTGNVQWRELYSRVSQGIANMLFGQITGNRDSAQFTTTVASQEAIWRAAREIGGMLIEGQYSQKDFRGKMVVAHEPERTSEGMVHHLKIFSAGNLTHVISFNANHVYVTAFSKRGVPMRFENRVGTVVSPKIVVRKTGNLQVAASIHRAKR